MKTSERKVLGIIEQVSFPELGISSALAKVDTGAYSGAIHCESIEEVINPTTGKKALQIIPINTDHQPVLIPRFARVVARSSTGHHNRRYIITTTVVVQGQTYDIRIGLTKRTMMNMKVLIGRRFIRNNNMLVDVTVNQELDTDGGRK